MREPSERTFPEVTAELDRRRFISMGFDRINALLAALGSPQDSLRVVQVVGTNGKGTTSVALSAALEIVGESTGTYLSPHVMSYAERVRVRGDQVSEDAFAEGMGEVVSVADGHGIEVTQFELLTAGALAMFRDAGVRWAVMEAGLGARYDATTASRPEAVVLTNVAFDHMNYLGDTIGEIATEKLASVPAGGTLIVGTGSPEVVRLARKRCEAVSARCVLVDGQDVVGEDVVGEDVDGQDVVGEGGPDHIRANIALGCIAAGVVSEKRLSEEDRAAVGGRVAGVLPGRFERVRVGRTDIVLDGGHNVAGLTATFEAVSREYPGRRIGVVFGVLRDKDIAGMLEVIAGRADVILLTKPDTERAEDPQRVRGMLPETCSREVETEPDVAAAVEKAVRKMEVLDGVVLVAGSFTTVAEASRYTGSSGGGVGDAG